MKKINIIYWICTGFLILSMLGASVTDLMHIPEAVAGFKHLGYPYYLLTFLGVARILGIVGILAKGYPRVTEWAYAGFFFDLTGAIYSGIAVGDPAGAWAPVIIGYGVLAGSYICYHERLKASASKQV